MSELTTLRKLTKRQAVIIQEQEVTISQHQAENLRLRAQVMANRRGKRLGKQKAAHA